MNLSTVFNWRIDVSFKRTQGRVGLGKVSSNLFGFFLAGLASSVLHAHQIDVRAAKNLNELKPRFGEILEAHDIPGLAVSIIEDGSVSWSGGFGFANRLSVDQISETSSFRAASISKTVTAIAILQLVESGGLRLSDTVHQIAPEIDIRNPWQDTDPVRVVHLLEHTAGLDDMHFANAFNVADDEGIPLLAAINRDTNSLHIRWRPGTRFAYSNPGYAIAGYLVEKISGMSFAEYTQKRVFAPLGMKHSTMTFNNNVRSRVVQGYQKDGFTPVATHPVFLAPAGGLVTSAADTGALVVALLSNGRLNNRRLLRGGSVTRMREIKTGSVAEAGLSHGYGLGGYSRVTRNLTWYGHAGGLDGFSSVYAYAPEHGVGYSVLINRSAAATAITEIESQLRSYLVRNISVPFPDSKFIPQESITALEGWYRQTNPRRALLRPWDAIFGVVRVEASANGVTLSPLTAGVDNYIPMGENTFRRESDTAASLAFLDITDTARMVNGWQEFVRVPSVSAIAPVTIVLGSVLLLASALLVLPFSLLFRLAQHKGKHPLAVARLLFFLCATTFFSMPVMLAGASVIHLAGWNWRTIGFVAAAVSFVLLSSALLLIMFRNIKKPSPQVSKIYLATGGVAGFLLSVGLIGWGVIGYSAWLL